MSEVDAATFPRLSSYLEALPASLDSLPEYVSKATLIRSVLESRQVPPARREQLPEVLRALMEHPPPVSSWIPTVRSHAAMLAVFDATFETVDEFERFAHVQQRRLFSGPLYRILFTLGSPAFLLRGLAARWGALHRGTSVDVTVHASRRATVTLESPPGLWEPVPLRGVAAGLRAVVEMSGEGEVEVEVVLSDSGTAVFEVRW